MAAAPKKHRRMPLFSLIDLFCIDANKLALFFFFISQTEKLTPVLSDSWS